MELTSKWDHLKWKIKRTEDKKKKLKKKQQQKRKEKRVGNERYAVKLDLNPVNKWNVDYYSWHLWDCVSVYFVKFCWEIQANAFHVFMVIRAERKCTIDDHSQHLYCAFESKPKKKILESLKQIDWANIRLWFCKKEMKIVGVFYWVSEKLEWDACMPHTSSTSTDLKIHHIFFFLFCFHIHHRVLPSFFSFDWFANESIPNNFMPALTSSKSMSVVWNASDTNSLSTALFDCTALDCFALLSWDLFTWFGANWKSCHKTITN